MTDKSAKTGPASSGRPPLAGLKVIDLTLAMAGPMCTQRLGEMGADVIKIEAPGGGDIARKAIMAGITKFEDAVCFVTLNRNKRSLVVDLKAERGRDVVHRLIVDADVVVQNYRPRVAGKLGIDYATLSRLNPRLVYVSISGYGDEGPMKDRPGQDLLLQSFAGLTLNGGTRDGLPHPSPLFMVDVTASHAATEGVLAALLARHATGVGQEVKISMLAAIMEMQCQEITSFLEADAPPVRSATPQVSIYQEPPYGVYRCAEGWLAIAQADLGLLGEVIGEPMLEQLKQQRPPQNEAEQLARWRDEVCGVVASRLAEASAAAWDEALGTVGIWCGIVNDYQALLDHPQTIGRLVEIDHPVGGRYRGPAPAISFSDDPEPRLSAAPLYGADSRSILATAGWSQSEIDRLEHDGVIIARRS